MNIKDGWKTSEFWVSLITAICGICIVFGVFKTNDINEFLAATEKLAGILMTLISTIIYTFSRAKVKQNSISNEAISEAAEKAILKMIEFEDEETTEQCTESDIEDSKVDSGFPFRMED